MHAVKVAAPVLKGLSFDVADLILLEAWSAAIGLRMAVNLDHGCDVDEYEEVLTFHSGTSPLTHWIMWRNATTVFVQTITGRRRRFRSVARAIEALERTQRPALTDIHPTAWPSPTAS
jgi:hypothetical protein